MTHEERDIQKSVVKFIRLQYPHALFTCGATFIDPRHIGHAVSMGYEKGTPDLHIDEPRGKWHGMKLELKSGKGTLSEAQTWYIERAEIRGYYCQIAHSVEEACRKITDYMLIAKESA